MSITIESRTIIYSGWTTLSLARVCLADGTRLERVIEDHGDAATVLAYDPERKCALLVQQFRAPAFYRAGVVGVVETVAGKVEGETAQTCARREALEEAGVELRALEHIADVWTSPGFTTERFSLFLAEYRAIDRRTAGGGAEGEHENITVLELPLASLSQRLKDGQIDDLKTLALLQALRLRRPELFAEAP
jgi:nudix-type nucleoside diphosphatase (YffH/AdpP family)